MRFTVDRYAALARKYDQQPTDVAVAAFEAMRADATRAASDPWAVITVAVRCTLQAEQRANGLLTSPNRARRGGYTAHHDAERFSDRAVELADYHAALQHHDQPLTTDNDTTPWVIDAAAEILTTAGWPPPLAHTAVTHICEHLADIGSRSAAYEALRRDKAIRAHLDLSHGGWIGLLRATLGHPTTPGPLAHGLIARLLAGDPPTDLIGDPQLMGLLTAQRAQPVAVDR